MKSDLTRRRFCGAMLGAVVSARLAKAKNLAADVCIYGGTSGGIMAAVQAARMGKSVILAEPGGYLGGMSTGGLSFTDFGNKAAIGGLAREFYRRVGAAYGKEEEFNLEPHVAAQVFHDFLAPSVGTRVLLHTRLAEVQKRGQTILRITTESGRQIAAKQFIDATYEGDLLKEAGVSYGVGRESNAAYGETLNGIQGPCRNPRGKFEVPVDPWRRRGDPSSGPLPYLLQDEPLGVIGSGDHRIQAYNYRVCLTDRASNLLSLAPPKNYDPANFELLARWAEARRAHGENPQLSDYLQYNPLPNGKYDFNNRWAISTDFVGGSEKYPEASWSERAVICQANEDYLRGYLHFLATSPRVSDTVRGEMSRFGLCRDEFRPTRGWPHQFYVREARRMVSDYVMTERHARGTETAPQGVGLAAYSVDIHPTRRIVFPDGQPATEGSNGAAVPHPYPIDYRSIVPKASECTNLLVPFCLSASHIGFGSIRMEPVFMVLGQSSATAACLAIDAHLPVQELDYGRLRARLLADHQVLDSPIETH